MPDLDLELLPINILMIHAREGRPTYPQSTTWYRLPTKQYLLAWVESRARFWKKRGKDTVVWERKPWQADDGYWCCAVAFEKASSGGSI